MIKKFGLLLAAMALSVGSAMAASFDTAQAIDLTLVEGDKTFSDFFVSGLSDTEIAGLSIFTTNVGGVISVNFQGPFTTTGTRDIGLWYTVATDNTYLISGIGQLFNLTAQGTGGTVAIGETVFSKCFVPCDGNELVAQSSIGFLFGVQDATDPDGEPLQGDQLVVNPPAQKLWVSKDIFLQANDLGLVGATIITQSFTQVPNDDVPPVPEPATMLLFSTALLGLGFLRRKKS